MKKENKEHAAKPKAVAQLQDKPNDFLIVGIGASAGGIQALQSFFRNVPKDANMAYVVILHLSPDHDSQLASILQAECLIPVLQVNEKVLVEPNHIYVVPPDRHLALEDDYIAVLPNVRVEDRRAPVDIFFRSLADRHGPRAICVVLSGTGANGSMGLKRIKERGGATYVQNPREAEFNEMPRNAIATELVDEVLNVTEIPSHIIAYRNSMYTIQIVEDTDTPPENQQVALREIFTQLRVKTGHDFSNYKRATLLRRIERRINVHNLKDLHSYKNYVMEHAEETHALLKDLLISVTNFFRDSKAFNGLEQEVLPAIFAGKTSEHQVRIWVAGCATGEEAYSLAILCAEKLHGGFDIPKVQIFATDIDESAIAAAREGLYSLNDAADVSPERLKRFFTLDGDCYRVRREIREMILFAQHNFLKDPPFSKLDLVTCRNVLIYLNGTAQERVIETFHFALKPKGFLFLGTSESVDGASDLYATFNRDNHIFRAKEVSPRSYPVPHSVPQFNFPQHGALQKTELEERQGQRISFGDVHQKMLEHYAPPSVVVNEEYDLVHMTDRAGRYFEFVGGEPSQNLLKIIRPEIRLEIRSALYQAVQNKAIVEARNIKLNINGESESIDIHIRPALSDSGIAKGFILIIFKPSVDNGQDNVSIKVSSDEPLAMQLEEELVGLKTQLRKSIERYEYQAEELKASNEELQSMNEELRSAAEELETSKEELQSINEELRTVNQELKVKIDESGVTSNNLQNLVNSANVGTIFLDRNFAIRLFTPAVLDVFNLKSGDYGRPVTDITHKFHYDGLLADAETVLSKLSAIEREVSTTDNRVYMMRLLPYRTSDDRINGVVITFFEITALKDSEKTLRRAEEKYRFQLEREVADRTSELRENYALLQTIYDTTMIGISVCSPVVDEQGTIVDFRIMNANKEIEHAYGRTDIVGHLYKELFPENRQINVFEKMVETMETGKHMAIEHSYDIKGGRTWYSTMFVKGDGVLVSTSLNITERKLLEEKRIRAIALLTQSEELAGIGSWDYDLQTKEWTWSDGMFRLFNLDKGNSVAPSIYQHYAIEDSKHIAAEIANLIQHGNSDYEEMLTVKIGEDIKVLKLKTTVIKNTEGKPLRILGVDMDITASKMAAQNLQRLEDKQKKEIFKVTLHTQEEERRRISESLHNGLGQLLYGIKISMEELTSGFAIQDEQAYDSVKKYTGSLLTDAIKESRRISHELMPMVLEEFGLAAAVDDICQQLKSGLQFNCKVQLGRVELDKYFELAVYRTVQELMLNVVKHAEATAARVDIKVVADKLLIRVEDNGRGFNVMDKSGIGLSSIRSKAGLLNGAVSITSAPNKGSIVEVYMTIDAEKT